MALAAVSPVAVALVVEEVAGAGSPPEAGGADSWAAAGGVVTPAAVVVVVVAGLGDHREEEVASKVAGSKAASREDRGVGSHRWMDRADLLLEVEVQADTALQVVVVVVGVVS